ncbi:LacI family DNA-binding transcriptional regulator [Pontiellaceae bacterium B12227]|nr:LacI family DNA-binding transcriptional regulator [Pontiellaceae bacterium B12227]
MGVDVGSANLSEIAERLDISIATVSRALRGIKGVHPATRARILEAADEMGYVRESRAEVSTRSVLVLAQTLGINDAVQDVLSGISEAAIETNSMVMTHVLPFERCAEILDPSRQLPALSKGAVDGALLVSRWPDEVVEGIVRKLPVVSLIHQYPVDGIDRVGIDNEMGMRKIVGHLVGLGHRKIGFFGLHPDMSWSRARYGAYVEALVDQRLAEGIDCTISISLEEAMDESMIDAFSYVSRIKEMLGRGMTALVCSNDLLCYGIIDALMKSGIRVPDDISLSGFHFQSNRPGMPELTTVSLSSAELGSAALRRLVRRLEAPSEAGRAILLPCGLVVGSTTSALPA